MHLVSVFHVADCLLFRIHTMVLVRPWDCPFQYQRGSKFLPAYRTYLKRRIKILVVLYHPMEIWKDGLCRWWSDITLERILYANKTICLLSYLILIVTIKSLWYYFLLQNEDKCVLIYHEMMCTFSHVTSAKRSVTLAVSLHRGYLSSPPNHVPYV